MNRRSVGALLLCVLLLTAGCSSLLGDNARRGGGSDGGATATPTAVSGTEAPSLQYFPNGYSKNGEIDSEEATDTHTRNLIRHDSYTITYRATVQTPNRTVVANFVERVDTVERRAYIVSNVSGGGEFTYYYANDSVFIRSDSPRTNGTRYTSSQHKLDLEEVAGKQFVRTALSNITYDSATVFERDGETFIRYEAKELTTAKHLLGSNVTLSNVTSFSATLVVDTDGVVRHAEYDAIIEREGQERSVDVVIDVTELDSTTFGRPDWTDKAS